MGRPTAGAGFGRCGSAADGEHRRFAQGGWPCPGTPLEPRGTAQRGAACLVRQHRQWPGEWLGTPTRPGGLRSGRRGGTSPRSQVMAVYRIPPGPGALEPYRTEACVRRCAAPTAPRRAPSTALGGGRVAPGLLERVPALGHRCVHCVGLRQHTSYAPQDHSPCAPGETAHSRFHSLSGLHRCALVGFGHPLEVRGTVGSIKPLTSLGPQGLDAWPSPRGPIPDDAAPPRRTGSAGRLAARLWDLLAGLAALLRRVSLRPTEPMDDASAIQESTAPACGLTPLAAPARVARERPAPTRRPRPRSGRGGPDAPSMPPPRPAGASDQRPPRRGAAPSPGATAPRPTARRCPTSSRRAACRAVDTLPPHPRASSRGKSPTRHERPSTAGRSRPPRPPL